MNWKIVVFLFLGISISLIGYKYRIRQYDKFPYASQNFDEYGYLWLGKSLLKTGVPANWSALDFYNKYEKVWNEGVVDYNITVDIKSPSLANWRYFKKPSVKSFEGAFDGYKSQFLVVQPYLDNPPLAGIIFALVDPGKSMEINTVKHIRLVPIILLSITIFTIFLLGYLLVNINVGIISALIYALGPGFVISGRMAVPENLISALFPFALLIYFYYQKTKKSVLLVMIYVISFIAIWLKVGGIIIPFALMLISFNEKKYRLGWTIALSAILGFLSYVGYCLAYSQVLFFQMINTQSARMFNGPAVMLSKILHPEIPAPMYDGWIILGYISILGIMFLMRKNKYLNYLSLSVVGYLLFFTIFGGLNYPWYQFIIYPILALSLGVMINYFLIKPCFEFNLLYFLVIVSTLLHYSQYTDNWINYLNTYRILFTLFVLTGGIGWFFRRYQKLILRVCLWIMFFISLYLSIKIINKLNILWPLMMQNKILF